MIKKQNSYEYLTSTTQETVNLIIHFLPKLSDINYEHEFTAHNQMQMKMKITIINNDKINKLFEK